MRKNSLDKSFLETHFIERLEKHEAVLDNLIGVFVLVDCADRLVDEFHHPREGCLFECMAVDIENALFDAGARFHDEVVQRDATWEIIEEQQPTTYRAHT